MQKDRLEIWRDIARGADVPWLRAIFAVVLFASADYGQILVPGVNSGGAMRLLQTDFAVLEQQESRNDLPCTVSKIKPELNWDFRFRNGYRVDIPLTSLVGNGNELTVVFRVVPQDRPDAPSYMVQKIHVPPLEQGGGGQAEFSGIFTLGEGRYHVNWLMRDRGEHICSLSWDVETKLNSKDAQLRPWVPPALVQPSRRIFAEEPRIIQASANDLPRVSVIMNFDPPDPSTARLDERDLETLVAILRRVVRDPRIRVSSFIACSFETQQVIYQEKNTSRIHFPALGEALKSLKLGMVDAKRLASTNTPAQFTIDLVRENLQMDKPDALVVLGHRAGWQSALSREALDPLEEFSTPAFYLSYSVESDLELSRDRVSSIIKRLHGVEYGLTRPKDLFNAWSDVVSRTVRATLSAQDSAAPREENR